MQNIINSFVSADFPMTLVAIVAAIMLLFIVLMLYTPWLSKIIFPEFGYKKYSEYLPFGSIIGDNKTVKLKNGEYVCVYKFSGVQTSMQDSVTKENFLDLRTNLFNQINDTGASFRFFTIRDRAENKTDYEFDQVVLQKIYDKWDSQGLKIFNNNYYLVLGATSLEKLNQYGNYIESVLAMYKPSVLKHNDKNNIATFFARILSPVSKPGILRADSNMSEMATVDNTEFAKGGRVFYSGAGKNKVSVFASF